MQFDLFSHRFVPDRWEIFPPTSHQLVLDFSQHFEENSDGNMEGGNMALSW